MKSKAQSARRERGSLRRMVVRVSGGGCLRIRDGNQLEYYFAAWLVDWVGKKVMVEQQAGTLYGLWVLDMAGNELGTVHCARVIVYRDHPHNDKLSD